MKLARSGYGYKALLVLLFLGLRYGILDAKAIKKSKHAVHKSGSKKNNAPKGDFCVNHSYCTNYSDLDCASQWVQLNCPRMCRLCEYEGPDLMQLPAVLYIKKGDKRHGISGKRKHKRKHTLKRKAVNKRDETPGGRRDVVFLSKPYDYKPTERSPTTSYTLFNYKSNYRNWQFQFPEEHPVYLDYVDQGKSADANQQASLQQQSTATQNAAVAPAASAPTVASVVAPAAAATPAVSKPAALTPAAPVAQAVAAPAAPSVAQQGASAVAASVASPAPAAAAPAAPQTGQNAPGPAAPQLGQTTAAFQQPAASVAGQQPAVAQPVAAAAQSWTGNQSVFTNQTQVFPSTASNQTIELINQTVTLANDTQQPGYGYAGFQPNVSNVTQKNGTVLMAAYAGNTTNNQTVATGSLDLTSTGQSFTQDVTVDSDGAAQTPWTCCNKDVKPPKDCKPCPQMPKAPPMPHVFNVYCDDLYKDCAYGYSNCNDTWWQINCPKTCNLCKAKDKVPAPRSKEILPNEVKDLDTSELQSDLVAPVPGDKPLVAKYTLRVKPKLLNGIPQMQEIRIMPPNKTGTSAFVKPLMVLKQNITKPMIENIEIDVPKKGAKYSRKPSVEVIEGDHKEMLDVTRGKAVVEDAAIQRSDTNAQEPQEVKPLEETQTPSTDQTQSTSTSSAEERSATQPSSAQTQSASFAQTAEQPTAHIQSPSVPQTAFSTDANSCTDDSQCATYVENQCSDAWLKTNCKRKCNLC